MTKYRVIRVGDRHIPQKKTLFGWRGIDPTLGLISGRERQYAHCSYNYDTAAIKIISTYIESQNPEVIYEKTV